MILFFSESNGIPYAFFGSPYTLLTSEDNKNCHIPSTHLQENKEAYSKEGQALLSKQ